MDIASYIESLAAQGRYHFGIQEAAKAVGSSAVAARAALRRLRRKGRVAMPFRGFCVFVPPEYRRLGCLPPEQFVPQLMEHLGLDYYTGLLSAAEIHGAAHQRPQEFQAVVAANRPGIECGSVRVRFVARRNVARIPTVLRNTLRGQMKVSTPEATAFDLVGYSRHCGGLDNVATVLKELAESLDAGKLAEVAALSPVPWAQRLGFLLELAGAPAMGDPLARRVSEEAGEYVPLSSEAKGHGREVERSTRWKLLVNEKVEPDL